MEYEFEYSCFCPPPQTKIHSDGLGQLAAQIGIRSIGQIAQIQWVSMQIGKDCWHPIPLLLIIISNAIFVRQCFSDQPAIFLKDWGHVPLGMESSIDPVQNFGISPMFCGGVINGGWSANKNGECR
jgi:hypothetical protein